jgi:hypothetical protein
MLVFKCGYDDDHLMIETCWSDFKCFSVTFELMFYYKQVH